MRLHVSKGSLDRNHHGKDSSPIKGPTFRRVKLTIHPPSTGYRFIFYFPSGRWWHLDLTFDRRGKL